MINIERVTVIELKYQTAVLMREQTVFQLLNLCHNTV